jgi:hypothetical protein
MAEINKQNGEKDKYKELIKKIYRPTVNKEKKRIERAIQ